ncbi:oligosaccharide flippase family protein [Vibrio sp. EJY3]|uniref:oligosaccharide flippase family protein n=1 Tax=Vibrio sp. (strain EJY3) TaxID=1116375 RepID=UPI000243A586|nr:oligosaccharide flippase family protein [Vibrio sp. EJY3]AEX20702.1 polysaccharide biosynthesis protein [Vibrio sp. EJY3]
MGLLKKISFLSSSVFSRLVIGSILVFVFARTLGPEGYGQIVVATTISSICIVLIDCGYQTFIVKEVSGDEAGIPNSYSNAIQVKALLAPLYIIVVFCVNYAFFENQNPNELIFIAISVYLLSMGDFFNIAFRVVDMYSLEAKNILIGAILNLIVVGSTCLFFKSIYQVSLSMMIARLMYLYVCYNQFYNRFGTINISFSINNVVHQIKRVKLYALDQANVVFRSNVDVLIIGALLGNHNVGLYQAGMTLGKSFEKLAIIVANIFLVELSKPKNFFFQNCKKLISIQALIGGLIFFIFLILDEFIVLLLYGESFYELISLMWLFGLFIFLRFMASSFGVILTALNKQKIRVIIGIGSTLLSIPLMLVLVSDFAVYGAIVSQIAINVVVLLLFFIFVYVYYRVKL